MHPWNLWTMLKNIQDRIFSLSTVFLYFAKRGVFFIAEWFRFLSESVEWKNQFKKQRLGCQLLVFLVSHINNPFIVLYAIYLIFIINIYLINIIYPISAAVLMNSWHLWGALNCILDKIWTVKLLTYLMGQCY